MKKSPDEFYFDQQEPQKSTLLALRSIILGYDPHITETQKYGMPCFLYQKNILCYLWTDKKTGDPYMLMAEGHLINDPELEQGDRVRMKILRIDPQADVPVTVVESILAQAIDLYKKGTVRLKK